MTLATSVVVCLLLALPAGAMPPRASFPVVAQASQSEAPPDNSNPQQPARQDASPAPPPSAAPEQNAPPNEPPPDAAKPGQAGEASPTTAPPESTPATGQEPPAVPTEAPKATPPPLPAKKKSVTSARRKTAHGARKAKSSSTAARPATPSKTVVKNGSAAEPSTQLAPGLSQQQASSQRQGTNQLLASTDENLKKISGRSLASNQQDMVQQIRKYIEQAKAATDAGDFDRAHNLALKASLLAQELAKP